MTDLPIFLHCQFRTGGTFLWNLFRAAGGFTCYYEPLHELLATMSRPETERLYGAISTNLKHGFLERPYFQEYTFDENTGVVGFHESFPFRKFVLAADDTEPALASYFQNLISAADERAVFKLCRSWGRLAWMTANFPGVHFYVLRQPGAQWASSLQANHTLSVLLLLLGYHGSSRLFEPLRRIVMVPATGELSISEELRRYARLSQRCSIELKYAVFYYCWLLGLVEALQHDCRILDMDLITNDPSCHPAIRELLRVQGIELDLAAISAPSRSDLSLDSVRRLEIEEAMRGLVRSSLGDSIESLEERCEQQFLSAANGHEMLQLRSAEGLDSPSVLEQIRLDLTVQEAG